jgi:Flp pilus assembly protein TadD
MPQGFLSSEEYDEQANLLYNSGDYDGALDMLKEGLSLYPHAIELCIGLGYARLAREEFAWARRAFAQALDIEPGHEDAMVGMGETLLRLGHHSEALAWFREVQEMGFTDDIELMLTMGRALYREEMFGHAREVFALLVERRPECADAAASLGYVLHRLNDPIAAARHIRRALRLDASMNEARTYLGHLLYDRGDWEAALREFERVPPVEHWDPLAVWRIMELKRALWGLDEDDDRLDPWRERLTQLETPDDPVDRLLAEIEFEARMRDDEALGLGPVDPSQLELFDVGLATASDDEVHEVRLENGLMLRGSWMAIVVQMRDASGFRHESLVSFMRRMAESWHERSGVEIPFQDPESFVRAADSAGVLKLKGSKSDDS